MSLLAKPRAWIERQPLRMRLTALLVLLVLAACAVVGIATSLALKGFLVERLDQQLTAAGSRYATALEHDDHDTDNPETGTQGQSVGTLGARTVNGTVAQVGVIAEADQRVRVSDADRAVIAALRPSGDKRTIELPTLGRYRVQVTSGRDGDVLVSGLPQHGVDETMHHVYLAESLAFAGVVVTAGVIGAFAVRWSLGPLERVATTARRVSELPLASSGVRLDERIPESDPGTEVGQVSGALNHMLDTIDSALAERERSEDRLRRFVADASHELRTPLAVVRGHAELALRATHDSDATPEPLVRSLQRIQSEADRMGHLVDDLLLLARLDSGRPLAREDVDLSRLAIDAITDAHAAGPEHRWLLDLPDEPLTVVGDTHRLQQVLINLLTNARVHTPPGSTVTVRAEAEGEGVRLEVADNGPGIPADLQPRVLERFVHGDDARSSSSGSSGLGLAIVTGVVTAHGGRVGIDSAPGHTVVSVWLPRAGRVGTSETAPTSTS